MPSHLRMRSSQRAQLCPSVSASVYRPTFRKLILVYGWKPASKLEKEGITSGFGDLLGLIYTP